MTISPTLTFDPAWKREAERPDFLQALEKNVEDLVNSNALHKSPADCQAFIAILQTDIAALRTVSTELHIPDGHAVWSKCTNLSQKLNALSTRVADIASGKIPAPTPKATAASIMPTSVQHGSTPTQAPTAEAPSSGGFLNKLLDVAQRAAPILIPGVFAGIQWLSNRLSAPSTAPSAQPQPPVPPTSPGIQKQAPSPQTTTASQTTTPSSSTTNTPPQPETAQESPSKAASAAGSSSSYPQQDLRSEEPKNTDTFVQGPREDEDDEAEETPLEEASSEPSSSSSPQPDLRSEETKNADTIIDGPLTHRGDKTPETMYRNTLRTLTSSLPHLTNPQLKSLVRFAIGMRKGTGVEGENLGNESNTMAILNYYYATVLSKASEPQRHAEENDLKRFLFGKAGGVWHGRKSEAMKTAYSSALHIQGSQE